jgi:uncharacterized phage protein gp47/JayE
MAGAECGICRADALAGAAVSTELGGGNGVNVAIGVAVAAITARTQATAAAVAAAAAGYANQDDTSAGTLAALPQVPVT